MSYEFFFSSTVLSYPFLLFIQIKHTVRMFLISIIIPLFFLSLYIVYILPSLFREIYKRNPKHFVIFTTNPLKIFLSILAKTPLLCRKYPSHNSPLSVLFFPPLSLSLAFSHRRIPSQCVQSSVAASRSHSRQRTSPKFRSRAEIKG